MLGVGPYGYARGHRALEVGAIGGVAISLGWLALHAVRTATPADAAWIGLTALVGYLLADLLSGIAHWAADTLGDERMPLLGPNLIRPFREHHAEPAGITRHDFVETNGNSCIVSLPLVAGAAGLSPDHAGPGFFVGLLVGFTVLFGVATNQLHKWAHSAGPPRLIRLLQRIGLVLDRDHHAVHHAAPHDRHYCITTGWCNLLLDGLRCFRLAERVVSLVYPRLLGGRPIPPESSSL